MPMGSQKVLLGGNVVTMDESHPWAEALIVQDDRIRFVGTSQEARSRASPDVEFLDAVEIAQKRYRRTRDLRLRLEHAQVIRTEDIPRLRDLGVLVAAQPHALGDPEKDQRLLGRERALAAYPHRSLLDAGVALSFGSDFPGESTLDPLLAIQYVVGRKGPQAISVREALACYTRESAFAEFQEKEKGTLSAGKLADLVILSDDPLKVAPDAIRDIKPVITMVGGRVVYRGDADG